MSFSEMLSALCKVARDTVVPDIKTGSSSATGVTAPVRPTCRVMDFSLVLALSARYFHASAHLGTRIKRTIVKFDDGAVCVIWEISPDFFQFANAFKRPMRALGKLGP